MLVLLGFVSVPGAIQTIAALLKKRDNRCAAITMMGKTVELCYDQVHLMLWLPLIFCFHTICVTSAYPLETQIRCAEGYEILTSNFTGSYICSNAAIRWGY